MKEVNNVPQRNKQNLKVLSFLRFFWHYYIFLAPYGDVFYHYLKVLNFVWLRVYYYLLHSSFPCTPAYKAIALAKKPNRRLSGSVGLWKISEIMCPEKIPEGCPFGPVIWGWPRWKLRDGFDAANIASRALFEYEKLPLTARRPDALIAAEVLDRQLISALIMIPKSSRPRSLVLG